ALQGEGRVRRPRRMWSPTKQVAATGAGLLMTLYGWFVRRGAVGGLVGVGGAALLLRGTMNRPMPELLGKKRGVTVTQTALVRRPIHDVFDLWSRFDTFPLFM